MTGLLAACGGTASVSGSAAPASASSSASVPASAAASASSSAPASASVAASASAAPAAGTPIKIGSVADITGEGAIEGAQIRLNTDLAVQQFNASGGVDGHPVEMDYADAGGDAAQALKLATTLVQAHNDDLLSGGLFSPECLGIEKLAVQLKTIYVPTADCQTELLTSQNCNTYTFRPYPVGGQTIKPAANYLVKTYGKNWAVVYPDYAYGQSQLAATQKALTAAGGNLAVKIPIPLNEANVTPYVSKIPTNGSIVGIFNYENGSDAARVFSTMSQFAITPKLPNAVAFGIDLFGGVFPAEFNGAISIGAVSLDYAPSNFPYLVTFFKNYKAEAQKESSIAAILGGPSKANPDGDGEEAYASMNVLLHAMRQAHFHGKADANKLIPALANFKASQGPDFPAGDVAMDPADHQGRMTEYNLKINGQKEDILQTVPVDKVPSIGSCKISG